MQIYPVRVSLSNAEEVLQFIKLSLELGGFPLCKPIYEDDFVIARVQKMIDVQKMLI